MSALDWLMRQLGGDPEAEGAERTSTAMQPAVLDHLQNVLGDMPGRFGGGASYDPNRSLARNALDPESLQQAVTVGMQVGPAAIRAYHGSPHDFERFDLSKIGTGEGAQAYGHGLYFAEHEPTAVHYRESLAGYQPEITFPDGRKMVSQPWANDPVNHLAGLLPQAEPAWINTSIARAYLQHGEANLADNAAKEAWGGLQDRLKPHEREAFNARIEASLPTLQQVTKVQPGKMYEVNLHADPEAFLNYDKPLSEQPHVRAALDALNVTAGPRWELLPKTAMATASDRLSPQAASAALREAGIPGIKYLDQGSRDAGAGSRNYVMFDDKLIEILRKYGLAGLTAGTGAAALGGNAEAAPADALDRIRRQLGEGAF